MAKLDLVNPTTIPVSSFGGLYSRGIADAVPLGYFQDCLNISLNETSEIGTRNGTSKVITLPNIRRTWIYKRINETARYISLDTNGSLWDSLFGSPIITNAAFIDFSLVNYANRAYITFHDRTTGVGTGLYVYQGDGTIRLAAGTPPASFTLSVIDSVNSGDIEAGIHVFAVAFETDSGFVTAPGPAIFNVYDAPGNFKAVVGNIPVGPAGTVARWVLGSRVQPDYDGNQLGVELFFIPGGRINNNVDTSLEINFFDGNLYAEADYLFDNQSIIPAGTFVTIYQNRLAIGGIQNDPHSLYVSREGEPEVFDSVNGALTIDPSDATTGVTNAIEFRNSLYVTKGNRTYVTQALRDTPPRDWSVDLIDSAIGTECFGIATILDAKGTNTDRWFVADPSGLFVFESGLFRKPAISYNIEDIWGRINKNHFKKVQVAHDAENYIIYIAVPLDNATEISHLLVAFYENTIGQYGFIAAQKVRWSIYGFPYRPTSITVDVNSAGAAVLKFGSLDGNIYQQDTSGYLDDITKISSSMDLGLITAAPGWVCHFSHLKLRILGSGNANLSLKGLDNALVVTKNNFLTLNPSPGVEYGYKINFINEKMSVKISTTNNAGDYFKIVDLLLKVKPKWATRRE